jgi:hypothetical protein
MNSTTMVQVQTMTKMSAFITTAISFLGFTLASFQQKNELMRIVILIQYVWLFQTRKCQ